MKRENRRRMSPGVGYIGSGNKTAVFSRKSNIPFEKIKTIYGDEMERLKSEKLIDNKPFKKLSKTDRLKIKKRIKNQIRKEQYKNLILAIIVIIIVSGALYFISN